MIKKLMYLFIYIFIFIIPLGGAVVYGSSQYTDISKNSWVYESVTAMINKSIIKGYPDGSFKPDKAVTYGEFIKMALVADTDEDIGNAEAPENWAKNYYDRALERKYFTEYDIHKTQLSYPIPRGDMALIISSILGDISIEDYNLLQNKIKDINENSRHDYDITKSYAAGVLTGYDDNTFRPDRTLSRAESAVVMHRLVDVNKRMLPFIDKEEDIKGEQKTTIERLEGDNPNRIVNLISSSTSTFKIENMINNIRENSWYDNVKYYEIISDYPYKVSKYIDLVGSENLLIDNIDYSRGAILLENCKMIPLQSVGGKMYYVPGQESGSKLPSFEYLGFYNPSLDTLILIPNPL